MLLVKEFGPSSEILFASADSVGMACTCELCMQLTVLDEDRKIHAESAEQNTDSCASQVCFYSMQHHHKKGDYTMSMYAH